MKKENLIVFAAHPDDEVLGCGGTMKKFSKKYNIISVFFATGIASRSDKNLKKNIQILKKNCNDCNEILGTKKIIYLDFEDNKMDIYPRLDVIKKIEKIINAFQPSLIFTHYHKDLNIDHEVVSKSVVTACRPSKKNKNIKKILFFETLSSTEWSVERDFKPNYFVDITKFISFKLKAMSKYKTELQKNPMPRSLDNIKTLAKLRGSEINREYAESFFIYREVE